MLSLALVLLLTSTCYCDVEFYERPRNFSIELLYHTQAETDGHVVISPLGIWTLMTGIALGATGNSYKQLAHAFIMPKTSDALIKGYKDLTGAVLDPTTSGVSLTSKNFVFVDKNFQMYPQFKSTLQNDFDASVKILDFNDPSSSSVANTYIERSGGRVSNVLKSSDFQDSRLLLTNVISFKGLWGTPFNQSDTELEPFYNEDNVVIGTVNMMYQKSLFPFANMKPLQAYVLEMPYGHDNKYSMLFVLPYQKVKVTDMYRNLAKVSIKDIFQKLKENEEYFDLVDIDVKVPRFKISTNLALNKPLNNMGVHDIFQPDLASFQRVSRENIFVSAIIHKADIEVTESGTIATAATTAMFIDKISTPTFHANRPFLYFVIEKSTTTVIFSGIYSKPSVY